VRGRTWTCSRWFPEFRKLYAEQYIKLVGKLPQLWSWLYSKSDWPSCDSILVLKRAIEHLNTRKLDAKSRAEAGRHPLHAFACRTVVATARRALPPGGAGHRSTSMRCGCTRTWTTTAWPAMKWHSASRIAACRMDVSTSPVSR
jgi:hypothetical protein